MFNFLPTVKKLLPNGRAFRVFFGTQHDQLLDGSVQEAGRIKDFTDDVRDAGIPDGNLPVDALADWETFLALPTNVALTTQERNDRIKGKYASQGGQGPDYIEESLQESGYPVYVQENISPQIDPGSITGLLIPGPPVYFTVPTYSASAGGTTAGEKTMAAFAGTGVFEDVYTIPTDPTKWIFFFFLTGPLGVGDFVNMAIEKKQDFITRVVQLKPAHAWVIAQINFI